MGTGGAAHTTGKLRAAPPIFFSGNGFSVAAMCAELHHTGLSKTVLYSPAVGAVK